MRSLHSRQFGSTNWAFIITLLLMLVFVWLWYQETDKQENNANEIKTLKADKQALNTEGVELAGLLEGISRVVGWDTASKTLTAITRAEGPQIVYSDKLAIENNFTPDREVTGPDGTKQPGLLTQILAASQVTLEREARSHTSTTGEEKEYKYDVLSTAFKDKLKKVREKWASIRLQIPRRPADADDEQGKAIYKSELKEYERQVKEYDADLQDLSTTEGWKEYTKIISAPGQWADPTNVAVTLNFYKHTDTGNRSIQTALENLPAAFELFGKELTANMTAAAQTISQLRKDIAAKDAAIETTKAALIAEEEAHTSDQTQLQNSLRDTTERADRLAVEKTSAVNALAKEQDDRKDVESGLRREVSARIEQNRLLKKKADLVIARDDVDGKVLAANQTLGTGTIDLGTKDKVFVGLKFVVSQLDKNGNRYDTGEVMVVRVGSAHAATVRIVSGTAIGGARLHNPFYVPGERIYVYFAGKLDKWSKEMATARLAQMNAIVQDAPDGKTHYIVVPNSWTVTEKKASGDDDDGEEEEATGPTPLEETMKTARIFGASVITENLFDAFLDY